MKIKIQLPSGGYFEFRREPLEDGKFYALVALAAGALVVILLLGSVALK